METQVALSLFVVWVSCVLFLRYLWLHSNLWSAKPLFRFGLWTEAKPTEGGFSYPPFELRFGGLENPPSVKFWILQPAQLIKRGAGAPQSKVSPKRLTGKREIHTIEVISKLPKVGRFQRNRRLRTDGSESHPYLEFVNFEIGSIDKNRRCHEQFE